MWEGVGRCDSVGGGEGVKGCEGCGMGEGAEKASVEVLHDTEQATHVGCVVIVLSLCTVQFSLALNGDGWHRVLHRGKHHHTCKGDCGTSGVRTTGQCATSTQALESQRTA